MIMKKAYLVLGAVLLLVGCSRNEDVLPQSWDFINTGCASATKGGIYGAEPSLKLEYTPDGLLVTRKNAEMNCSIKMGGIGCDASVEGGMILYKTYEKNGPSANCICLVEEMSSTVSGLKEGVDYTLYYWCTSELPLVPIDFTYKEGFVMVIDPDLYAAPLVDNGDGTWSPDVHVWK